MQPFLTTKDRAAMRQDDVDLYTLLHVARRNAIWSLQGQNSQTTNMHIDATQHLLDQAISILKDRK
jgi:hypothetical protein